MPLKRPFWMVDEGEGRPAPRSNGGLEKKLQEAGEKGELPDSPPASAAVKDGALDAPKTAALRAADG